MLCQHFHQKNNKMLLIECSSFEFRRKSNIYLNIAISYRILIKTRSNMKNVQEIISIRIIQILCEHHA